MFLIRKFKPKEVTEVFNSLKEKLGETLFKKIFEVILTDNGWEFSEPADIEFNYKTGEKLVNVFFCDSYSSWQKEESKETMNLFDILFQKVSRSIL